MDTQKENYKIYLDVCCLNRPFDDWTQERIRLEGEAILSIMQRIRTREWKLVSSEAIRVELEKMRNLDKLENILKLLELAIITINIAHLPHPKLSHNEKWSFGDLRLAIAT